MAINKQLGMFLRTPLNRPIGFYLAICLSSTLLGALFRGVDLKTGSLFVLKYFEYVFIYFMVANHIREKRQIKNYIWALLITCIIVSLMGIAQIPGGGRVTAPFEGAQGEPNTMGGYLVFIICITAGLFLASDSLRSQLIYAALIFLFVAPLFYTQSRSSYLALIPAMLAFIWLSQKKRLWVVCGLIIIGLSLPLVAPDPAKERVAYTFEQGRHRTEVIEVMGTKLDTSISARLWSWKNVARDWIKHPILGYGVTGYRFVDGQYFRVLIETGLLGLIAFLILLGTIFGQGHRVFKEASGSFEKGLTMGSLAGFIGLMFHAIGANTFIIVRIMEPFWFVLAMIIMLPEIDTVEQGARALSMEQGAWSRE
jgi:O-antigen ligase